MLSSIRFLLCVFGSVWGSIQQSGLPGDNAAVVFDILATAKEQECTLMFADGSLESVSVGFDFLNGGVNYAEAGDMFATISTLDEKTGETLSCIQIGGYNYAVNGCIVAGSWNDTWADGNGYYSATVDIARFDLSGGNWSVCIGNGWTGCYTDVTYDGNMYFSSLVITKEFVSSAPTSQPTRTPSVSFQPTGTPISPPTGTPSISLTPTSSPSISQQPSSSFQPTTTPLEVISDCLDPVVLEMDAFLAGYQRACAFVGANNTLDVIEMDLSFSGSTNGEWASDLTVVVYDALDSIGVQIGGYRFSIPNTEYVGSWPATWQSPAAAVYTASVNVSTYGLQGEGYYYVCLYNGWKYASTVHYAGTMTLNNLVTRCDIPKPAPSASPSHMPSLSQPPSMANIYQTSSDGQTAAGRFDSFLAGDESDCVDMLMVGLASAVNISFYFQSDSAASWPADLTFTLNNGTDCLFVGGFDGYVPATCNTSDPSRIYAWPLSFQTDAVGVYNGSVTVDAARLVGQGTWKVCIANGYATSSGATYRGTFALLGLTSYSLSQSPSLAPSSAPSAVPSSPVDPDSKGSSGDKETKTIIAIFIVVPVCVVLVITLVVVYLHRHEVFKKKGITENLMTASTGSVQSVTSNPIRDSRL